MKGDLTIKILNALESTTLSTGELLSVFLCDYHTSYKKARKLAHGYMEGTKPSAESAKENKQKFYNLMRHLQQNGLVAKQKSSWANTDKGRKKLLKLKEWKESFVPKKNYNIEKSKELNIVIFDIPEIHRRKRDWLRGTLIQLGLSKLQQSVWIGQNKLPEEFLLDLKNFQMLKYVEIFSIGKTGTIKYIGE